MIMKLISIQDETAEDNFIPTQRIRKIYDLAQAININPESESIPEIYADLDDNAGLCGAPEIPISKMAQTSQTLQNLVDEYKQSVASFQAKVKDIEARAEKAFLPLIQEALDSNMMLSPQVDYVRFKDQDGNARVAIISCKAKEVVRDLMAEPKVIEYVQEHTER